MPKYMSGILEGPLIEEHYNEDAGYSFLYI